jgi:hypothetical protein
MIPTIPTTMVGIPSNSIHQTSIAAVGINPTRRRNQGRVDNVETAFDELEKIGRGIKGHARKSPILVVYHLKTHRLPRLSMEMNKLMTRQMATLTMTTGVIGKTALSLQVQTRGRAAGGTMGDIKTHIQTTIQQARLMLDHRREMNKLQVHQQAGNTAMAKCGRIPLIATQGAASLGHIASQETGVEATHRFASHQSRRDEHKTKIVLGRTAQAGIPHHTSSLVAPFHLCVASVYLFLYINQFSF